MIKLNINKTNGGNMIDLINLSKTKTKYFANELLARVFMTKLTYKANKGLCCKL